MQNGQKCYCLFAVIAMLAVMVLLAIMRGYDMVEWDVISWISGLFITLAVFICVRCRLRTEEEE